MARKPTASKRKSSASKRRRVVRKLGVKRAKHASAQTRSRAQRQTVAPRESGPAKWLIPFLESAYTALVPRDETEAVATRAGRGAAPARRGQTRGRRARFESGLQPGRGEEILATPSATFWLDRLREYKQRKAAAEATRGREGVPAPPGAVVPGARNWAPLGPPMVLNGQAQGQPAVGGRVGGIAVAPGGQQVYAASANGGVFRSDDAGQSWRSLMDAFDVDPANFASTSLACGAIAIDSADPNRIYVGTGEGDTQAIFSRRILSALPAYRGIGPIRSDDGGATWVVEDTAPGSPSLAGKAFFALAVDPRDREHVIAATTDGLYQRVLQPDGTPRWLQRRAGMHSSVVVASAAGTTRSPHSGAAASSARRTGHPGRRWQPGSRRAASPASRSQCSQRIPTCCSRSSRIRTDGARPLPARDRRVDARDQSA